MCQEKGVCGRVIIATCKKAKCLNSKYTWSRKKEAWKLQGISKAKEKMCTLSPLKQQKKNNKTKQIEFARKTIVKF